ncbi:extracellular solute-binding protein [Actinoplanes hulinensis]|uniref:Extracellular solute-binding protein n=1 Tax=Actinoplanes hulinensis TaxID=1144547 RepID=A0ABS7B0X2_9ACTN|nr:extracellular solute-binding protein [Actinoplanes hulinensis]MBW6434557.1 extracellular solute-binding protein [Actinoplanes hulinensis]
MSAALLVLPLSLVGTTACAKESAPAAAALSYAASEPPVTINFWFMPNGVNAEESMKAEAEEFHRLHPNITVRLRMLDWAAALTMISTAVGGGDAPDVAQLGTTWVGDLTKSGALQPYSDAEIHSLGGQAAFVPASWTSTKPAGTGAVTAVPWFVDVRALFYRTDVLRRLGLDPAKAFADWNALERTLAAIKREGKVAPLGQPGKNDWNVVHNVTPFIWGAGGDLLSADGTTPALSTPEVFAGVDYYQRLMANYNKRDLLTKDTDAAMAAFADGETAVLMQGPDAVSRFRTGTDRAGLRSGWSTAPLPAGPQGQYTFLGGSDLAIFARSAHHTAALEWVRFLTGTESQDRYAVRAAGIWPARLETVRAAALDTDPVYRAFAQAQNFGRQYPAVAAWGDIEAALTKDFSTLWEFVMTSGTPMPADDLRRLLLAANENVRVAIMRAR